MSPPCDDWYRRSFGEFYHLVYPHRNDKAAAEEVSGLVDLLALRGSGALVLDVGCGTGRHASAFADAGLRTIGVDLSTVLIRAAAGRPALKGRLTLGDMRSLPFAEAFQLVVNLFTSFGYFDDEENAAVLREMARVLVPNGRLVIDHVNVERLQKNLVARDTRAGAGYVLVQHRRIEGSRIHKNVTLTCDDGSSGSFSEDVRLYAPEELAALLDAAGLGDIRFYGSYRGTPYDSRSDRMIVVARKGGR